MRIVARYITKEILISFLATTGILLLIVLSNRFAFYLAKAASGELSVRLVFYIVGLYIPELLSYLIPLGFFIAILFAFGRLYVDSEMTVMSACGISSKNIIQLTLKLSLITMLLTALLTLWAVPKVTEIREQRISQGTAQQVMQSLVPQRFQTFSEGKLVFYLEEIASNPDLLKGVFIAERPIQIATDDHGWTLITAKSAHIKRDEKTDHFYLVLNDGIRYQGFPGQADYTIVSFQEYGRAINDNSEPPTSDVLRQKGTRTLVNSESFEDQAELQWRLSLPLSVPILALIAVPLARVRPRHGRFAKFLPAIIIYILYYNLFTICRRWVAAGVLPYYLGVWWIHGLFLLVGLGLIAKENGWLRRNTT